MVLYLLIIFPNYFIFFNILASLSDIFDGYIAQKTGTESEFGAKLDSIADAMFVIVCLVNFLSNISFENWIWLWIIIITIIKIINIIFGYIYYKRFIMLHTTANKITRFLLFCFPLFLKYINIYFPAIFICVISTFASIQERHLIRTGQIHQ